MRKPSTSCRTPSIRRSLEATGEGLGTWEVGDCRAMTTDATTPATLVTDDLDEFVKRLREQPGGKSGNKSLREALGWSGEEDRYWKAHGRAIDQGLVVSGRGKGGSVQLITLSDDSTVPSLPASPPPAKESDLYNPAKVVIEQTWAKSENYDDYVVEITAQRGSAATGGKWTRPDLAILGTKAFPYLPQRLFDIVTFEIKPIGQTTVEGIFEALSHQQFASRSYCVFHVALDADESFQDKYSEASRILSTARKHGIGVIIATNIADWETWDELLKADRVNPDPEQVNRFVATGFNTAIREKIIKWHK